MSAATNARRGRGPDELAIVAFERGTTPSYSACGIPYWIGGVVADRERLVVRTPAEFAEKHDIEVRVRHEVIDIDCHRGDLTVRDLETGAEREEPFDQLVIATGAVPRRPELRGADAEGILGVQTLDDGEAIRLELERKPTNVVVVGAGYIGLEMAEALTLRGFEVTLLERSPQPMPTLDPDMGALVSDALRKVGVTVECGVEVRGFDVSGRRVSAIETANASYPADLVILGLGVTPNVGLARDAGVAIGPSGGIATDGRMRTDVENVWAAGDCVESHHRVSHRPVSIALGTHANKQGRVAGINIGGGYATFPGVIGTAVTKVCSAEVARTGLSEREAADAGFVTVSAVIDSRTRAGYYPGSTPLKVKAIAERSTGRLLGAQIVGEEGVAKRIDVFATAIWNEMTAEEMLNLDLSYAPPVAPTWDPVLVAAKKVAEKVESDRGPVASAP